LGIQVLLAFIVMNFFYAYLIESLPSSGRFYAIMVMIAVVFTIVPLFLNLFALNRINAATIGILLYINPIVNFTVAFMVFKEEVNAYQIIGYAIVVVAVILFNHRSLGFTATLATK
jgi:chloramphenicol-sensitive protein RarD